MVLTFACLDQQFNELLGVPLLKLASGKLIPFAPRHDDAIFITSDLEHKLIVEFAPQKIIDAEIRMLFFSLAF